MAPNLHLVPDNAMNVGYKAATWSTSQEGMDLGPEEALRRACADFERAVLEANIILSKALREFTDRIAHAQNPVRRALLEVRLAEAEVSEELQAKAGYIIETDPSERIDG